MPIRQGRWEDACYSGGGAPWCEHRLLVEESTQAALYGEMLLQMGDE